MSFLVIDLHWLNWYDAECKIKDYLEQIDDFEKNDIHNRYTQDILKYRQKCLYELTLGRQKVVKLYGWMWLLDKNIKIPKSIHPIPIDFSKWQQ